MPRSAMWVRHFDPGLRHGGCPLAYRLTDRIELSLSARTSLPTTSRTKVELWQPAFEVPALLRQNHLAVLTGHINESSEITAKRPAALRKFFVSVLLCCACCWHPAVVPAAKCPPLRNLRSRRSAC